MEIVRAGALFGLLLAAAAFSGWRGSRPWDPLRGPRLVPWRLLLAAVHAANVLGVSTGGLAPGSLAPGG